jgi:hypothetical protein
MHSTNPLATENVHDSAILKSKARSVSKRKLTAKRMARMSRNAVPWADTLEIRDRVSTSRAMRGEITNSEIVDREASWNPLPVPAVRIPRQPTLRTSRAKTVEVSA